MGENMHISKEEKRERKKESAQHRLKRVFC